MMNLDYQKHVQYCKDNNVCYPSELSFMQSQGMHLVARELGVTNMMEWLDRLTRDHLANHADITADCTAMMERLNQPCSNCGNEQTVSRGLGDTVARITHATGLDKLAHLYTEITGKDCGCQSRQEALNKLFPYGVKEEE